ncbi:MAG TPA: HAD-IIB family hydrolase [Xanthobacteraceae bacterium]|jgi:HAD superfamily hydrolase (TIGR01484 family)|nr:HAD-IIB family hydrolase [Xanthobacteraceae bacterium]
MFFVALATDYDGTLALQGHVDAPTRAALDAVRRSGRKLILVTGRDLPDLRRVFDEMELFDMVVAENGGLLLDPATREEIVLTDPPPVALIKRLRERGVQPLSVGRTIIATREPNEGIVLEAIRSLNLEQHIVFNKGAVMILPTSVNKASGLKHALARLNLSPQNVVGVGDAENDIAFLGVCGCAVAVNNALPTVKAKADFVVADHGAGIVELASLLTVNDLASARPRVPRALPVLGAKQNGESVTISPFETVLVTGSSGGGKSTIVTALLEQMRELTYQFCVIDPEGDYGDLRDTVMVGDAKRPPQIREVVDLLAKPDTSVVINLLAVDPSERPRYLANLLPDLGKLRRTTGRPHWIVIDEVHHCLPAKWDPAPLSLPRELPAAIAVTVHPQEVASDLLALVSVVVGVGAGAQGAIEKFCDAMGRSRPMALEQPLEGSVLVLRRDRDTELVTPRMPKEKQKRHVRKYSEGDLGADSSFYFRGPERALNLRAQNLVSFLQLAAGVDDKTWLYHLRDGGYSRWFRGAIKDEDLAREAAAVEGDGSLSAPDSRARMKELVERRYTAPAKSGG